MKIQTLLHTAFEKLVWRRAKNSMYSFFKQEAAHLSWKCINIFSNTSDNNKKAANLQEKLLKKTRVQNDTKIRKWYNQLLNSLKHKYEMQYK